MITAKRPSAKNIIKNSEQNKTEYDWFFMTNGLATFVENSLKFPAKSPRP